ncbi:uncharacterized protein PAC_15635 [Phialocephala subalpina]|uniref:Aminoglycoside phosphotransferase domain-containing protein n=1 Tax=Phialocephala subalpina TaxID=576137 RepID=A0A1L7XKZ5_9HELO|nr:uncharacterized protein PAC_15635 [Phialocephala subalpina]
MASIFNDDDVKKALSLIQSAKLPHPSGPLLSSFIIEALYPRLAAHYLVESIPDAVTQAVITKRDGGKCCITGKAGRFWDPLIVVPVLPVPSLWIDDEPRIFNILGAFFTPSYRDWWLVNAQIPWDMSPYHNHWLVRRSGANAFVQGVAKLDRLHLSMDEYEVKHVSIGTLDSIDLDGSYLLLGDYSRLNIEKVDPRFIGTHARLSPSCRWLEIAKQISPNMEARPCLSIGRPSQRGPFFFSGLMKTACLAVWLMASGDPDRFWNEFNALQMVRRYTSVPVPQPLDLVITPTGSDDPFHSHDAYLLTSRVPGIPLSRCQDMLSDRDGAEFVAQMQEYLTQIRATPKAVSLEHAICDTLGGSCRGPRISSGNPVGPFVDEAAFNKVLRNPDDPSRRGYRAIFTHTDLNLRNILADRIIRPDGTRGADSDGTVDWENSGYYPEYWDYTNAFFEGFRCNQRWRDVMHEIFKPFGNFSKEFEVEKRSWEGGNYI